MIYERAIYPVLEYAFKHPLTHEVALGAQLNTARQRRHGAVAEAIALDVPAPVITLALQARLRSRVDNSFADRLLAIMRNQFGGHAIHSEEAQ